jgi:hypothetical protein
VAFFMTDGGAGVMRGRLAIGDKQKSGLPVVFTIRRQTGN